MSGHAPFGPAYSGPPELNTEVFDNYLDELEELSNVLTSLGFPENSDILNTIFSKFEGITDPAEATIAVQSAFDESVLTNKKLNIPKSGVVTNLPVVVRDNLSISLDGILSNEGNQTSPYTQPAIYIGVYNAAFTSPKWVGGTSVPMFHGTFNKEGEFVLDAAAKVTEFYDGLPIGEKMLFLSDAGYEYHIGKNSVGGTGIQRETAEFFLIASKTDDDSIGRVVPDRVCHTEHVSGVICRAYNTELIDSNEAGTSFNVASNVSIVGRGGFASQGMGIWRTASSRLHMDIDFIQGKYGLGGNMMIDAYQRVGNVIALEKPWDVAASSRRVDIGHGSLECRGFGSASSVAKIGENSRYVNIKGKSLVWKYINSQNAFSFLTCRDCNVEEDYVYYPGTLDCVQFGTATAGEATPVDGGVLRTDRNSLKVGNFQAVNPRNFVQIFAVAGTALRNTVEGNFYGKPSQYAVYDNGVESRINAHFENGHILLAGQKADIDVTLDNGVVLGISDTTAKRVSVNGERKWPGNAYAPALTAASAEYAPDLSKGRVGENRFEHHILLGAGVTSLDILDSIDGVDTEELTLVIHNGSNTDVPITTSGQYTSSNLTDIVSGNKSVFTFINVSDTWVLNKSLENQTFNGRTLLNEEFTNSGYWVLPEGVEIKNGGIEVVATGGGDIDIAVPQLRAGATYIIEYTISGHNNSSARVRLGDQQTSGLTKLLNSDGDGTATIVAGNTPELVRIAATSTLNVGFRIESFKVREV